MKIDECKYGYDFVNIYMCIDVNYVLYEIVMHVCVRLFVVCALFTFTIRINTNAVYDNISAFVIFLI